MVLRAIALILLALAYLICVLGFSLQLHWKGLVALWGVINRVTDDGLGIYGPSPLLESLKDRLLPSGTCPVLAISESDLVADSLELPESEALIWAKQRWTKELSKSDV